MEITLGEVQERKYEQAIAGKSKPISRRRLMTHTPGPWKEHEGFIIGRFNSDNEIHDICDPRCAPVDADTICEMDANARLIAAAPELLKVVQDFIFTLQDEHGKHYVDGNIIHGKAAWVKATGETWKDAEYEEDKNEDGDNEVELEVKGEQP